MAEVDDIEREYRELSARIAYALLGGTDIPHSELERLEELTQLRVRLSAPNFRQLSAEAA